ncbi:zinc ribbon domain-containing protein [Tessaracoccus massiliensis]|uniref:zinc ribbon domain-containing protein n=1 Tax=Tessaracoccus massiliensis TaxID=1522311 RepID=UPI00058D109F|nr:C4-type zinc ribbon domain-containing protein [Tessaracoccus massiliensis]
MLADPADQRTLLTLADLDSEVARVQHAARSLPQHKTIADLMSARKSAADELVSSTTHADDLKVAVRKAEADLLPVKARLERTEQRVADGSVTDGKTLRSLTDEVGHLNKRISELEDEQLEVMGRLEDAVAHRDKTAARKAEIEDQLRAEVATRDEAVAKLSQEAKDLAASRSPLVARVPDQLMALYEKLRSSTGLGAAQVKAGRCTGCQLQLTLSDLDAYKKAPADQVLRCAECNRILVRTGESGL